jgi:hypothetical protein
MDTRTHKFLLYFNFSLDNRRNKGEARHPSSKGKPEAEAQSGPIGQLAEGAELKDGGES